MAKRTRRPRRLEFEKPRQTVPSVEVPEAGRGAAPALNGASPALTRAQSTEKAMLNLAEEYYHVYRELRNILIITVVMFAVMVGLSFVI